MDVRGVQSGRPAIPGGQEGCKGCPRGQGKSRGSKEVKRDVGGVPGGQGSARGVREGQGERQGYPRGSARTLGVPGGEGGR